jgi:hypothetical protein
MRGPYDADASAVSRPGRAFLTGLRHARVHNSATMPSQDDVRRIALSLPSTAQEPDYFRFLVEGKAFAWVWLDRPIPKKARVPNQDVVAIRVGNESEKEALIDMDPDAFFTEPHYNGFPAILVRLDAVDPGLLEKLLIDAWRIQAPKRLAREFDASA